MVYVGYVKVEEALKLPELLCCLNSLIGSIKYPLTGLGMRSSEQVTKISLRKGNFWYCQNVKFILLPGALPPGPPTGLCPCTPLGASAIPRPLVCVGASSPQSRLLEKYHCLLQILLTALSPRQSQYRILFIHSIMIMIR